jgi:2',3'-cyclic-nucleotide 3'-phosphodiesterase
LKWGELFFLVPLQVTNWWFNRTTFFTKVTIHLRKTPELLQVAMQSRVRLTGEDSAKAKRWLQEEYTPHLSLVYAELSKDIVEKELLEQIRSIVEQDGVSLKNTAWTGGSLVVVECWRPIEEWAVIAERKL